MDANGRQPSRREAGTMFGPDVTKRFLEDNHLDLLVRSHEVKMEGYDVQHDISFLSSKLILNAFVDIPG